MKNTLVLLAPLACALGDCADQMLGSDRARDSISGSLGLPATDMTIVERRPDGPTNTSFIVDTRANGRFVCTINGGNIMTFGMTNDALSPSRRGVVHGTPMTRTHVAQATALLACPGATFRSERQTNRGASCA